MSFFFPWWLRHFLRMMKVLRQFAINNWSFLCTTQPKLIQHTHYTCTFLMLVLPFCWVKLKNIFKKCIFLLGTLCCFSVASHGFWLLNMLNSLFFGHQALYMRAPAYSLAELLSHNRVGLNHSVKGVLRGIACAIINHPDCLLVNQWETFKY